jgi:hypothetical protein
MHVFLLCAYLTVFDYFEIPSQQAVSNPRHIVIYVFNITNCLILFKDNFSMS